MNRRCDPEQEGKRQVPLAVTNPVFSKLISLGRKEKKTPVAMAQELFEEAYAARCLGKSAPPAATPAFPCQIGVGDGSGQLFVHGSHEAIMAVRELVGAVETLIGERDDARSERENIRATRMQECESLRASAAQIAAERDEARRERDALSQRCWNAETKLEAMSAPPVAIEIEPGPLDDLSPLSLLLPAEQPPAPPGKGTVKAVLAMRGMGATPAEIAKDLALRPDVVSFVLKEARA